MFHDKTRSKTIISTWRVTALVRQVPFIKRWLKTNSNESQSLMYCDKNNIKLRKLFLKRNAVTYNCKQPITGSTGEFNGVSLDMKYSYRLMVNLTHRKSSGIFQQIHGEKKSIGILAQFQQSSIAMFQDINYLSKQWRCMYGTSKYKLQVKRLITLRNSSRKLWAHCVLETKTATK